MSETPKKYDPSAMRSIYDTNGGDSLLENCNHEADLAVFFCLDNVLHPGTIKQQKLRYTKPGFKLVEIDYTHENGTVVRSIKYMLLNGVEYRAENVPLSAYMVKE